MFNFIYKTLHIPEWRKESSDSYGISMPLVIVVLVLLYLKFRRRRDIPPGPPVIPVVGNLFSLGGGDILDSFERLRKKYGNIYSLYIGSELVVVLNGYDLIHEALVKKGSQFLSRPPSAFEKITKDETGIIYNNGRCWREQRRFLMKAMQNICLTNSAKHAENILLMEIRELINAVDLNASMCFDITDLIHHLCLNVMFLITYGRRFDFGDERSIKFAKDLNDVSKHVAKMQVISNCFPFLKYLPGDLLGNKKRVQLKDSMHDCARYLLNRDTKDNRNTLYGSLTMVEAYNDEIEKSKDGNSTIMFTEEMRENTLVDVVCAGGDTTATAVMWIILNLVREQHVQQQMYQEIVDLIGRDKEPLLDSRKDMPYTQAVILEGLRIVSTVPLGLPHCVNKDTHFRGFVIPAYTTVIPMLSTALRDPDLWPNPDSFEPNRFLSHDGKEVGIPRDFVAFSLGPRSCPGETFAKQCLFLILVSIVQRYELLPSTEFQLPDMKGEFDITYKPKPFRIHFRKRQDT